jgi:hypothetical protein
VTQEIKVEYMRRKRILAPNTEDIENDVLREIFGPKRD